MNFTIQTYNTHNTLCLIDCICEGTVAKKIYDQYRKLDIIMIFGQLIHTYNPTANKRALMRVEVLDFTLPISYKIGANVPDVNQETKEMLDYVQKKAFEYFSEHNAQPSDEEIEYWVKRWKAWRDKRNLKERK